MKLLLAAYVVEYGQPIKPSTELVKMMPPRPRWSSRGTKPRASSMGV